MAIEVIMPKLGLTMVEGKILEWKKREGEEIKKGEILYVIETEKITFEVEAPMSGILGKIVAKVNDVIPVGEVVAYILEAGERIDDILQRLAEEKKIKVIAEEGPELSPKIKISPVARKLAKEHNIDIGKVRATGPGSRIVREDILRAIEESRAIAAQPAQLGARLIEEEVVPLSPMRKVIAKRMTESFQTPHFYLTAEFDAQELERTREQLAPILERKSGIRLTFTDLLIYAVAKSLEDNPSMTCAYADGSMNISHRIDIGFVTAVEGGLIVPVIRQADKKSLAEIAKLRTDLSQKARERKISMEEMTGSTFTISNLGMFGIDQFSAILQPPEAAILAIGRIADRAVVRDGQIVIRPVMTLTLSIDHRVLDGVIAAQFLQTLKNRIQNPISMLL